MRFESCDSEAAFIYRMRDSDGDSESTFRDSISLQIDSRFCFSLRNIWRFQGLRLCAPLCRRHIVRGRDRGVEKRGGWKTSRMTPLPKRGFGTPLVRYVFHSPQMSVLCFSCTRFHDRADPEARWRGQKFFGRARCLVRFPPPIRFAPPHITAQHCTQNRTYHSNKHLSRLKEILEAINSA